MFMFQLLKQLKYLKFFHLLLFTLKTWEASPNLASTQYVQANTQQIPQPMVQQQFPPVGFVSAQPQEAHMYPVTNEQMLPAQIQPDPNQIDPNTQPQQENPSKPQKKRRRSRIKINRKALADFENVGHVAENLAASGALGPLAQGVAIAAKSAEAVIKAAVHGESAEQALKAGAKTAVSTVIDNSPAGQLAVMAAGSAGVPIGGVTGGLVDANQGGMGAVPGGGGNFKQQLMHEAETKVANIALKEAAQHGAPVPEAAIAATEQSGGGGGGNMKQQFQGQLANMAVNQVANTVTGVGEPTSINPTGSAPVNTQLQPPVNTQYQAPISTQYQAPISTQYQAPISTQFQSPKMTPTNTLIQAPIDQKINPPAQVYQQQPAATATNSHA